jgi:hypothetical protein
VEVVVSNVRYYPSSCLVKPVGVAHIPAKPILKKKWKMGHIWSQFIVQYQQVRTASNHQLFHAQVMKNSLSQVIFNPIS